MAEEEQKKYQTASLAKAMRQLNTIEVYYAKMICQFSNDTRLKIYRKLASLMRNRFSLMDALDLLHDLAEPYPPSRRVHPKGSSDWRGHYLPELPVYDGYFDYLRYRRLHGTADD